jgi:nucleotide-binding universal stress UspA family protein
MLSEQPNYHNALHDFNDARIKASMQEVLARLTGKSNELLSYEDVAKKLRLNASSERGVHEIPLNSIIGSVGRYTDFNRSFLPLKSNDQERWARVKAVIDDPVGAGWPPIDVYQVGEVYFVLDGNHRVSVARQEGFEFIQAHIIEVKTDIPLTPDIQPDGLIIKAEYADFIEETSLPSLRPNVDLSVTVPGQYEKLKEYIAVHRYFMGLDQQRDISYAEAVLHWYDTLYLLLAESIRERGLLRWFPGRTETDLYLWVSEHRAMLESDLGWDIRPEAVMADLAMKENPRAESEESAPGSWRMSRMLDRYTDRLFRDILVPLSYESESWQALEQAILVAQNESAHLHGLHILPAKAKAERPAARAIQARFNQRCQEAQVTGNLAIEKGDVSTLVCERALLTDLVVLNVAHPPSPGLSSLGSGLRSILWRSARPILTVPGEASRMDRALVAFDGSPKSKEALFVAAYLAESWKTSLTVLTISEEQKTLPSAQDYAHAYLELHELQADFMLVKGSLDMFLEVIREREINLVLMGGYGGSAWQEVMLGSAVNLLLREAKCPLLICR